MAKFLVRAAVRKVDYFEREYDAASADAAQAQAMLDWGATGSAPDGWTHEERHNTEITFDEVMVIEDDEIEPV